MLAIILTLLAAPVCPQPGDAAPKFSSPLARAGRVSLGDLLAEKEPVVLAFFRFDCEPCKRELPELERLSAKLNASVLAVHIGGPEEKMIAFLDETHLGLRVAFDEFENISERYCAQALPQLLLIDTSGVVRNRWTGEQPKLSATLESALAALPK